MQRCKLRLQRQAQQTPSCEQSMLPRAHQVTAAVLHILQHCAYDHYCQREVGNAENQLEFEDKCHQDSLYPSFSTGQLLELEV